MRVPSPDLFFDTVKAYQRTAALKAALDLDVFTGIGEGNLTASALARRCHASVRGMRMLCDALVVFGFLKKDGDHYGLTADSAAFLDAQAPDYVGCAAAYLLSPMMLDAFRNLTAAVKRGGTVLPDDGFLAPEHAAWVQFAQAMAPVMREPARLMAELIDPEADKPLEVLDVAAGHGLFGLAFAARNSQAHVTALDWPNVLVVARANAGAEGVAGRFSTVAGSVLTADLDASYDVAVLANLLHHFDRETCVRALRRVHACLRPGGRAVLLEFVPNADRTSPAEDAAFALVVLATTPGGDVYAFAELEAMCCEAGFARCAMRRLAEGEQMVVVAYR